MRRRPGRALAAVLAAAVIAVTALPGCEDEDEPARGLDAPGVGPERAGSVAPLAQCRDWERGTVAQRRTTIEDIRRQLNQSGNLEPQPDLPAGRAYELLDQACSNAYAAGFRLYKIYSRGAAFSPLAPPSG